MNLHRNLQIAKAVVASTALAVLAGCDGTNATEVVHVPNPVVATVYVAQAAGTVSQNDNDGNTITSVATGLNRGVAFDQASNLVQVGDNADEIRTFCGAATLSATPPAGTFRSITGLTNPVGIDIAHEAGAYIVTNNTTTVSVYASGAAGGAAPLATFTTSGPAWGVAYDDVGDQLFVANTDGTIDVFVDFVADSFGQTAANRRTIDTGAFGSDTDPETIDETGTVDFRGIAYDPQQDRLVVSDVGAVGTATDGRLLIIENASIAEGGGTDPGTPGNPGADPFLVPDVVIAGAATGLGDPMGISLKGVTLRVADAGTDQVLFFQNIFVAGFGVDAAADGSFNATPTGAYASTDPESVVADHGRIFPTANDAGSGTSTIAYVSNVASGNPQVIHYDAALTTSANAFDTGEASVENIDFDPTGDGYLTFDDGSGTLGTGGLMITHRLAKGRDGDTFDADRDRIIQGAAAGLASPKGVAVLGRSGFVAVAENSANGVDGFGIYVYSACASGNVAPITTVDLAVAPWDVDYDATTDRLFVALTDGTFQIYRNFVTSTTNGMASVVADPLDEITALVTVTLDDGVTSATNLHGVHYVGGRLILSDVGATGDATDGAIWVVPSISNLITYVRDPAQDGATVGTDAISAVTLPIFVADDCADTATPCAPAVVDSNTTAELAVDVYLVTGDTADTLGNPVDVAFDGANLYVSDKTGTPGGVLLYEDFMDAVLDVADPDTAAANIRTLALDSTASVNDTAAESVSPVPDYLSIAP